MNSKSFRPPSPNQSTKIINLCHLYRQDEPAPPRPPLETAEELRPRPLPPPRNFPEFDEGPVTGRPHYPPGRLRKGPRRPEASNNGGNRPLYIYNPILFGPKAAYGQPGRGYEGTVRCSYQREGVWQCWGVQVFFFVFRPYWLGRSTYFAGWQGWGCAGSFFCPCWLRRSAYFSEQNRWTIVGIYKSLTDT